MHWQRYNQTTLHNVRKNSAVMRTMRMYYKPAYPPIIELLHAKNGGYK